MATETLKQITFPDVDYLAFTYDPATIRDKESFVKRAREHADNFKAQMSSCLASTDAKDAPLFVEYMGYPDQPYFVGIPQDEMISLTREQVISLRDGLTRILDTEENLGPEGLPDRDGLPSYWAMAAGFLITDIDLGEECPPAA